jgi:hypothetical protein
MNALGFALACINFSTAIITWMKQKEWFRAGADAEIAKALGVQNDEIQRAFKARDRVRVTIEQHPDQLRADDPWRRD